MGVKYLANYATIRLEVRRGEQIKIGNDIVGNNTKLKVVKNKVAPPFRTAEVDIMYGEGISKEGEIIDLGVQLDIIEKSGAWYAYNHEKIGQGRENAKQFLRDHPLVAQEIEAKIRETLKQKNIFNPSDDAGFEGV
ncbi:MAG: hypothetical protein GX676_05870 [Bacilli bacterium]|nr:hypothetical protein [Bacilli bacterium]